MTEVFNPQYLKPDASLNKREFRGATAYLMFSAHSLADAIRQVRSTAGPDSAVLYSVNTDLTSDEVDEDLYGILSGYGENFAIFLRHLLDGESMVGGEVDAWEKKYLEHWQSIRRVYLGGGLMNGKFGEIISSAINRSIENFGLPVQVVRAGNPSYLPVIGLARSTNDDFGKRAIFDFGNTNAKRALATYDGGLLRSVDLLKSVTLPQQSEGVAAFMADTIASTIDDAGAENEIVRCSVASYMDGLSPVRSPGRGLYSDPDSINPGILSERVSGALGRMIGVELCHDGTAAARAFAGQEHTAVIMLGTALGVGFVPDDDGYCNISEDFYIRQTP